MTNHIADAGKMPPWANEPTPVSDEQRPQSMGINRNVSRNLERRMRAAERLLEITVRDVYPLVPDHDILADDINAHLEAARKEDEQ